jgi:RNA polymerase sigma-B factor
MEDLEQVAALGLVKALRRFDPARGVPFRSFAIPTILGELRRYFRDATWSLRPSRTIQELAARVATAREELTPQLQRAPTTGEVADFLGDEIEDVVDATGALDCQVLSLDGPAPSAEEPSLADRLGSTDDRFEFVDDALSVGPALAELSSRDRLVVVLRFEHELSQSEIAERVGVSQMHVSRILRKSLERLRALTDAEKVRGAPLAA